MNDVWFGADLTHRDLNIISQSLSLLGREPSLVVIAERGTKLLLASRALFKLFAVADGEGLGERLLGGQDPGSRRLIALAQQLAIDGAPRLERLRFFVGPASEVVTFLCRRVLASDGQAVLVAAALGLPLQDLGPPPVVAAPDDAAPDREGPARIVSSTGDGREAGEATADRPRAVEAALPRAMGVQAILATLRTQWPTTRSLRFLWRTDADLVLTEISAPLAAIVGTENADLVEQDLTELAGRLDGTGRLGEAVAERRTWSGIDVLWPIADASAAVEIGLGAMPIVTHEGAFEGYRGYGVIHLDRVVAHEPARLRAPTVAPSDNVVTFPGNGSKSLSPEDQQAFRELGDELRDQVGPLPAAPALEPSEPVPVTEVEPVALSSGVVVAARETADVPSETADLHVPEVADEAPPVEAGPGDLREAEVARNALKLFDRLSVALLVSRDNIPIYANRQFLELTGFADEDELHAVGGMGYLFGGLPGNNTGAETVCVRARDGTIVVAAARVQRIDWDGLPATLLTLQQPAGAAACSPDETATQPSPGKEQIEVEPSADSESETRELRAILETATDGVVVIDSRCDVVSMNRSGEALFGCDRHKVIGRPFLELFATQNQCLAADYFEGLKSNATKSLLNDGREIMIQAHQGGAIPVFMTLGRLGHGDADAEAGLPRFCALFRDLTPWKKVERELEGARHDAERASALKSDFLTRVNHEIRTPITAIIGFAETMLEERFGPVGNDRYKEYLRDIQMSGSLVVSLVNDLLDLAKIEAGKMELAPDAIDTNKIVADCVSLMQPQASRERVIMRLSLAPNVPPIRADDRSLRQIVLNILSNAIKFNEPGGQVILATTLTEAGCVVIRIRDTGPGMSDEDLAAALEPFRQLATNRSTTAGTGLGLPLTKALVEANEAVFTIRSKVRQGTLVEVSFPPARVLAKQGNG